MELGECVKQPSRVRRCLRRLMCYVRGWPIEKPKSGSGSGLKKYSVNSLRTTVKYFKIIVRLETLNRVILHVV